MRRVPSRERPCKECQKVPDPERGDGHEPVDDLNDHLFTTPKSRG